MTYQALLNLYLNEVVFFAFDLSHENKTFAVKWSLSPSFSKMGYNDGRHRLESPYVLRSE